MGANFRLYVLVVLLSAAAASSACSRADSAALTEPATAQSISVKLEPNAIVPALDDTPGCSTRSPFDLKFVVHLDGPPHVSFHRVRFRFEDRSGRIEVPTISMGPGLTSTVFPNVGPIPFPSGSSLPTSTSIPMPQSTPLMATVSSFGSARQLPLRLHFNCGVDASGVLVVIADFDDHGRSRSHERRVDVR